ncbi:unnamed protein product [Brassicogethes aeneus]|uniref:isoleucine--tRNA ligase n=1 Tax=Brassicogethes aeneus TaxID=1431903 RepID=A0A9P0ARE0_BRAAE|nr:unnamed protein product [Brassicogethes aeneus]
MITRIICNKQIQKLYYSTDKSSKKVYTSTVLLPKTDFPLRLENKKLLDRDENINKVANFEEYYGWQQGNLSEPEYVLHDGPPYANGPLHMGHAINKILKDTILRYKSLNGIKVHYIPGWDCHGLPIELKAISNSEKLNPIEIRTKARQFAKETIEKQMEMFKAWGILGDWKNHYTTYSPEYVKNQLRVFYKIYEKGLIYRDVKPIFWSPSSRTALAEAELEYNENHKSPAIYVKIELKNLPNLEFDINNCKVYGVIWTTTPWTLPSNQAICYNNKLSYSFIKKDSNVYLIATDLVKSFSEKLNHNFEILSTISGKTLSNVQYVHPVYKDRECRFYNAGHVSDSKGTGLVHTAPAHGPDDFKVALNNKFSIVDLVDEKGCYKEESGDNFKGKFVLTEGNKTILNLLKEDILHSEELTHSYPYDWRTKKPVIIRASKQWFIDTDSIKNRAVEVLEKVNIIPKISSEIYKKNLINQIKKRPYWCISRQRKWGVPIPVFYERESSKVVCNEETINHYCNMIDLHGTDFWWKLPSKELIPSENGGLEKGEDILDIWFDSGTTWSKVLDGRKVADLYLEGVDQFTGWFQSSLLTSVAIRDKAPYKSIYVHGFAVDENGSKMSKSVGNVVDPLEIVKGGKKNKPYGVDVLRWWVACHANQDSMAHVSTNVLKSSQDEIQKIRSVLRFTLGALSNYDYEPVQYQDLLLVDKYMLHLLYNFNSQVKNDIENYQFQKVCISVINLLTNGVSALYYTSIKDRLYCDLEDNLTRKSAQFVLYQLFEILSQAIAGIVPHLVEEMYLNLPGKKSTYFRTTHLHASDQWQNPKVEEVMDIILSAKKLMNKQLQSNTLKSSVKLKIPKKIANTIKEFISLQDLESELVDILQISSVKVEESPTLEKMDIEITPSSLHSCPRCRKVQSETPDDLCKRCNYVVNVFENKKAVIN